MSEAPAFAAVLLAYDDARIALQPAIDVALEAGARPVVVVISRDADAPAGVRVARVSAGTSRIGALRAGMALLTNTVARLALLYPVNDAASFDAGGIAALVDHARGHEAAVTAFAGGDLDRTPVIVARDAWLELMTLGEQGIAAVGARRGVSFVAHA